MITPVILSGGVGSRLWPLSRKLHPKQLQVLHGEDTMLQATCLRLKNLTDRNNNIVVCNETHRFLVAEQLRQIKDKASILLEPVGRNTAPAIAIAAYAAMEQDPEAILLVLPADHLIMNSSALLESIEQGHILAQQGQLVTLGIVPNRVETGYGYIHRGAKFDDLLAYQVDDFKEKPDAKTAQGYLDTGEYYWNSGMFIFSAQVYLDELKRHAADIHTRCQQAFEDISLDLDSDFVRVDQKSFSACRSDSIDYAVMEHTDKAAVVPLDAGWNDIGAWSALWEVADKDAQGNHCQGDVLQQNSHNCYIRAEHRLVATVGIDNLIVVETADAVLVADKDQVQNVKQIVSQLEHSERSESELHSKVYRPWGYYETMDEDENSRFQVKRIQVNPGASLSLQMHHHRSEHWIVVRGTAKVTCDKKSFLLTENQSTYIPLGASHRLENPGKIPLEIVEIQSGTYLGEDDIVRLDDEYGRF